MASDAENIAPRRDQIPIVRMKSLIPHRKLARSRLADTLPYGDYESDMYSVLRTATNTFQTDFDPFSSQSRVKHVPTPVNSIDKHQHRGQPKSMYTTNGAAPDLARPSGIPRSIDMLQVRKQKTKKRDDLPTKSKAQGSLPATETALAKSSRKSRPDLNKNRVTPRYPLSPPPEDELTLTQPTRVSKHGTKKLRAPEVPVSHSSKDKSRSRDTTKKSGDDSFRSRKRARSVSRSRAESPNPKARKLSKLHDGDTSLRGSSFRSNAQRDEEEDFAPAFHSNRDFDDYRPSGGDEVSYPPDDFITNKLYKHKLARHSNPTGSTNVKSSAVEKSVARRRSSPARAGSRSTTSHWPSASRGPSMAHGSSLSRPTTPYYYVHQRPSTPPPPLNTLPPPEPPSPSDDPLLLVGPTKVRSSRKSKANSSFRRPESPTPGRRSSRPVVHEISSDPLSLRADVDGLLNESSRSLARAIGLTFTRDDGPMVDASASMGFGDPDTTHNWDDQYDAPPTDYFEPLKGSTNIAPKVSSRLDVSVPRGRSRSPLLDTNQARSVVPAIPEESPSKRYRPPSPWLRPRDSPAVIETQETNWMALQENDSDSDEESAPLAAESNSQPPEPSTFDNNLTMNQQDDSVVPEPEPELVLLGRNSSTPSPVISPQRVSVSPPKEPVRSTPSSDSPDTGFEKGKRLSERFAELQERLTREGRSLRFSEIEALPSEDYAGPGFDSPLKFSDVAGDSPSKSSALPDSSPLKSVSSQISDQPKQVLEDEDEEEPVEYTVPLQEVSSEQDNTEELDQEEEESLELAPADISEAQIDEMDVSGALSEEHNSPLEEESESQRMATFELQASVDVQPQIIVEETPEVLMEDSEMTPEDSQLQHEGLSERDASFISPIPQANSSFIDAASVHSTDDEEELFIKQEDPYPQQSTMEGDTFTHNADVSVIVPAPAEKLFVPSPLMARQGLVPDVQINEESEEVVGPSWEDESDAEPLVQIRSLDPMAAARAAAILNLHHEYIQGTPKQRETSVLSSRRSTSLGLMPAFVPQPRSSMLFSTPSRQNGDLGQLAATPSIAGDVQRAGLTPIRERSVAPPSWTKHEWRALEQCFTDIRLETAIARGVEDVDPEEVDLDDVVDRFVDNYADGIRLKGEWSWDKMRRRVCALIGRQKDGLARGLAVSSPASSVMTTHTPLPSIASTMNAPIQESSSIRSQRPISSRDMPPPSYIPSRPAQSSRSQSAYPMLPPLPSKSYQIPPATPLGPTVKAVREPMSASRRMLKWMGSFLRSESEPPASSAGRTREFVPALPPISDADREALRHVSPSPPRKPERIVHPKEQVQLQHVPTPVPIRIPRPLNHKSSSGSVKDMVKSFESLSESDSRSNSRPFLTKKTSTGSLSVRSLDSSRSFTADWSNSRSGLQESPVGSVRSIGRGLKDDRSWIRE